MTTPDEAPARRAPKQKSRLRIDALQLTSAGGIVQVVAFLLLPVMSRLYAPDALGQLGLFMALGGFLAIPVGGRYEQAIVVARSDHEKRALTSLALYINGAWGLLVLLAIPLLQWLTQHTQYASLGGAWWAVPAYVVSLGLFATLSCRALAWGRVTALSVGKVLQGVVNNVLRILWPLVAAASLLGLLFSLFSSYLLGITVLLPREKRFPAASSWKDIRAVAAKYSQFPKYTILQAGIDTLLGSLLVFMLSYGYSNQEIGWVSMAFMLAKRPLQVIADGVSQSYFRHLAHMAKEHVPLLGTVLKFVIRWLLIACPTAVILYLLMPTLVYWVVGTNYAPAADIIRLLLPVLCVSIPTSIFNVVPDVLQKQRQHLHIQLIRLGGEIAALLIAVLAHYPLLITLQIYFLAVLSLQVIYAVWLFLLLRKNDRHLSTTPPPPLAT